MIREFIQEGNIQKTLENVCLILHHNDSQVEQLEEEFISICDYIGSHMDSNHVMRWLDIIENTYKQNINFSKLLEVKKFSS